LATSFTKNYSVNVTYKYDDGGALAEGDLNPSILRAEIIKRIEEAARISKGILQARPGSVTES
jgi:hypothetical protein